MIYLASPYSHPDPQVMEFRFDQVCRVAGKIMAEQGIVVYSPIAHNHPIAVRINLPRGWDFWEKFDTETLTACKEIWVLKLDGWDTSKGVAAEVQIAKKLGLPEPKYLNPKDYL